MAGVNHVHQTLPLVLLIILSPAGVVGYVYHLVGYRSGGRYDQ